MSTIKNLLDRVSRINLRDQVPVIIENTSDQIIDINQSQLYLSGENSKSEKLRTYESEYYAKMKQALNPNPGLGRPDLYLTGAFYRSWTVKVSTRDFMIDATDTKTDDLTDKYGTNIFGFTDESRNQYIRDVFFQNLKLYIESGTGLKFSK